MPDFNGYEQRQEPTRYDDRELEDLRGALLDNAETVITYLLGQPNRLLSSKNDLRWGDKGSLAFTPSKGVWHSHEDGEGGDLIALIRREQKTDFAGALAWARDFLGVGGVGYKPSAPRASTPKALPAPSPGHPQEVKNTLALCGPAAFSLVVTYLEGRGLALPPCEDILYAPDLAHVPSKRGFPAMVCHIRNAAGESIGIHRTWLADDGKGKAPVTAGMAKMTMKAGGDELIGAIRLFPVAEDGWLGVAEGIETALSAANLFGSLPVWSCISTSGMKRFEWPEGTKHLVIFADRDEKGAGRRAAEALRDRALAAGLSVTIRVAQNNDFNDDLKAGVFSTDHEEFHPALAGEIIPPPSADGPAPVTAESIMAEVAALTPDDAGKLPVQLAIAKIVTAGLDGLATEAILQTISKNTKTPIGVLRSYVKKMAGKVRRQGDSDWKDNLILDDTHSPKGLVENVLTVFRECPDWQNVIMWDDFSSRVIMRRGAPWMPDQDMHPDEPWRDAYDTQAVAWLSRNASVNVKDYEVNRSIQVVAEEHRFHPVCDYLDSLIWDGIPRIDTWLHVLAGAENTPYTQAVGARWLISAVARVYRPGCKVDHVMILEGPQGLRKSSLLGVIGGDWYTDDVSDVGNKDTIMQCHGRLIIEFAELDSLGRAEIAKIKAFITRTTDRFRPPYGRSVVELPRQFVFAGTVNPDNSGYLKDPSGGRRFWPVPCTKIDLEMARANRDQLWAEARTRFANGESWWLNEKELIDAAQTQQEARYQGDPWDKKVIEYLNYEKTRTSEGGYYLSERAEPLTDTTMADLLEHAIVLDPARWTKGDQMRVGHILKMFGFVRYQRRIGKGPKDLEWRYRKEEAPGAAA